jgi:hypothetical protein
MPLDRLATRIPSKRGLNLVDTILERKEHFMTIDHETPAPASNSPNPAPPGSRKCPYCTPDRAPAEVSFGSHEVRLLGHFLGSANSNRKGPLMNSTDKTLKFDATGWLPEIGDGLRDVPL